MVAKQRILGLAILAACSLTVVACAPMQAGPQKDKTYHITLLHTNDHHGRFWPNKYGEYGLAARKSLVDEIRQEVTAEGGHVLLLSGGDINTGVPESDLQDAEPDFKGMNMIGYDAMAIGNHEFDNPIDILRMQEQWANFPFLAANIYDSNGKRLFEPYKIFNVDGLRIGVMGLTTEDTKKLGNPEFIDEVQFTKPSDEAAKVLPELKKKADVVIAATHMGHYVDANYGINAPGDVTLARTVSGIDVIVGGHSQDPVCMTGENQRNESYKPGDPCMPDVQNGTLIMQAHEWGKYVGRADLEYRNGELKLVKYQLIPVNLKKKVKNAQGEDERVFVSEEIKPDQKVLAFLQPYQDKGQEQLNQVVGDVDKRLEGDRKVVRFKPTNLGHLIAAAQMEKVKADLAVMNSGGVRDSIDAGPITYKEVLMVQPFANMVSSVDLSGKELLDYLRIVAEKPVDSGAFAQFAGVQLQVVGGKLKSAKVNGKPINPKQTYRMAINSYIASGGDGYPKIDTHPGYVNSGFVDAEVLMSYLKKHSPVKAADHEKAEVIRK